MSWIPRKYLKRTNNEICFGSCLHFSLEKECFRFYIPFWHWVQKNIFLKNIVNFKFQIPVQVLKKPGNVMENCLRGHAFFYIFLTKNLKKYMKLTQNYKKKKKECVCGAFPPFPTQPNSNSNLFQIICSDITQFWEEKKNYLQKLNFIQMRHESPLKVPGRVIFYCVVDIEIYTDLGNYTVHL